ncbi:hypothetical protein QC334_25085 [Streptomyces sp. DH18]|uniref:hypothetical protein n=1 Tax=unclassified Streptomyces TaxID=2593676 RepID=UPI0024416701|nr:hypothetical protein [Streptomyces sp. DH18]MDG9685966.1 hypothetical protein [Streptomyces sp. DH18]
MAAERHYLDAVLLHGEGRLANADHHFGYATECALKSLLMREGEVKVDPPQPGKHPAGKPYGESADGKKKYWIGHLPHLVSDVALVLHGRTNTRLVMQLDDLALLDAFDGWDVQDRYLDGVAVREPDVARRRTVAERTLSMQQQTHLPGVRP